MRWVHYIIGLVSLINRYSVNVPLRDGISDENYKRIFEPVRVLPNASKLVDLLVPGG